MKKLQASRPSLDRPQQRIALSLRLASRDVPSDFAALELQLLQEKHSEALAQAS